MMYIIGENLLPSDDILSCAQVIERDLVDWWQGVQQGYGWIGVYGRSC